MSWMNPYIEIHDREYPTRTVVNIESPKGRMARGLALRTGVKGQAAVRRQRAAAERSRRQRPRECADRGPLL